MRVLHVIEISGIGGAENLLNSLLPAQQAKGAVVDCLVLFPAGNNKAAEKIGSSLEKAGVRTGYIALKNRMFSFRVVNSIRNIVKENGTQIIHAHLKLAEYYVSLCRALGLINVPTVTTIHGISDGYQNQYAREEKDNENFSAHLLFARLLLKRFSAIVFVSDFIRKFHDQKSLVAKHTQTFTISNGYIVDRNKPVSDKSVSAASPKIIMSGRLIELKGHKFGIDAIGLLQKKYPGIRLSIYGSGPFEAEIRSYVEQKKLQDLVQLKGFRSDIIDVMKEYNIALLPSLFESFGMVFLDAFYVGLPVVSFDLPAGNEIVAHKKTGWLAPARQPEGLAEGIDQLLNNVTLYNSIRTAAFSELKNKYDIKNIAGEYLDCYDAVLNQKNKT